MTIQITETDRLLFKVCVLQGRIRDLRYIRKKTQAVKDELKSYQAELKVLLLTKDFKIIEIEEEMTDSAFNKLIAVKNAELQLQSGEAMEV